MDMQISQPWMLSLCLLALLPPALAVWARRRGRLVHPLSVACQSAAVLLLAAALSGPSAAIGGKSKAPWLIVRDMSGSTRGQDKNVILPADLPAMNLDFAAWVAAGNEDWKSPEGRSPLAEFESRTSVSGPLRLAASVAGQRAGALIVTDGRFADPDWLAAAAELGKAGLPTFILPLDSPPADANIASFQAIRRSDGDVELRATIGANGPAKRMSTIERAWPGKKTMLNMPLSLLPLEPATINCIDKEMRQGLAVYRAGLDRGDPFPENDSATASVLPPDSRLALISPTGLPSAERLSASLNLPVAQISPAQAGDGAAALRQYAAAVLVDPDGKTLDERARAAIAEYVRSGGGLVLVGTGPCESPQDLKDPLNAVAALTANPFQRCPLRLIVALDSSGSMSEPASIAESGRPGQAKFELAVQAVVSLERHLTAGDSLAVLTFAGQPAVIYDSGSRPADFSALATRLYPVRPSGQTDMTAAFARAAELAAAPATSPAAGALPGQNLLILVSDLQPNAPSPFEPAAAAGLLKKADLKLAIVETRAADQSRTTALRELAAISGAQIAPADRLSSLADVFAQFVRKARGDIVKRADDGKNFHARAIGELFGRTDLVIPPLDSYILCTASKEAQVQAFVPASDNPAAGDPVIGRRLSAAGRCVSVAVPLSRQASPGAADSGKLLDIISAATRWVMRPAQDGRFNVTARFENDRISLRLDARDPAGPMNLLDLTAVAQGLGSDSDSKLAQAPLRQIAPGIYSADLPCDASSAGLEIRQADGQSIWRGTADRAAPPEYSALGADWDNLRKLAGLTGGKIIRRRQIEDLSAGWVAKRYVSLLPFLLAAAILLVLLDWLTTRVVRRPPRN
ncbi:MAG: VWA domain-containing protein [Planctomycetes bacterium]|nr:VWA domain-containing protein [Planctomycetota bacterium]